MQEGGKRLNFPMVLLQRHETELGHRKEVKTTH